MGVTTDIKAWIDEHRAIHAAATEGPWMQDDVERDKILAPDEPGGWDGYLIAEVTDHDGALFSVDHNGAAIVDAHNVTVPTALSMIEAVLELHKPVESVYGDRLCSTCAEEDNVRVAMAWPCPTVRALEDRLTN